MDSNGTVGIFWYCPACRRLISAWAQAGSNQVERNGNWVDFKLGHADVWPQVEAQIDWSFYPDYDEEYFYLPRGRILWNIKWKQHRILRDVDIDLDVLFEALADQGIDRTHCEVLTDSHYRSTLLHIAEIRADLDD